ncbi:PLDc N-terminal domain-containing protein [Pedobacter mucosus]|uniref:PLDc N-terminal domain-containing protein n=1 Tax=Pedobacter mucosus TaxID=2895286 RepID=UPI001EE43A97|nr:PLDc N-terminal domain-containing protein [Pedobacter mucosus]UKT63829.1 PLDc N-terminal domain-containing protein [Pedobacter mucosus]
MILLKFLNMGSAEIILILIIAVIPFILTLYTVIDIMRSNFKENTNQILFLLLVLLVPVFGSIIYLFLREKFKSTLPKLS